MTADDNARDADTEQTRVARRLCRLFRIERAGRFETRPAAVVQRLIARRDTVIDALLAAETQRRRDGRPSSAATTAAFEELRLEVDQGQVPAAAKSRALQAELRKRNAGPAGSGLRNKARGRFLGSS